ncbi:SMI1/KNR4 family protein [Bacillus swezeyi]|uniref:SMI1/KNR4 family protein n=1 Tax=Bacillus swezeyi TaxID=1925020 RepID=A0A1R1QPU6_9BACI|nr:SMI1/KNR4 family protein [Bacillus swezeyi]MEC1261439.1 SMI1/KNR4 family protein [Bacillus swezeyi]MED2926698.1 SMI1/KNR4 family protein [Bacillus swezeyi]MED2944171.1 SMI1/KNR4 family protein [Bacillus swezeyi]MED2965740.1 SMI1/KNR4 family protein [Bacillus swezeyi]MED3070857.1 SMI1/KNR4 family protein [Bacillus swezeyi]
MQNVKWRKRSTFKEATNEQIHSLEETLNIEFPLDYKEYIKEFNGCSPVDKRVVVIEGFRESINNLLSIGDPERPIDLYKTFNNVKDRLVDNVFPFATDAGGNLFCFDYRESVKKPTVVFWDHEEAFENPDAALTYVCDNFIELINSLQEYEEEE